jgi:ureidoglycolate hydrolase
MTSAGVHALRAEPLTTERWAPFGWLPVRDTDPRDGESRLHFAWDDVHLNIIAHFTDEIPHVSDGLVCQMLFRHVTHTQALMVLDNDSLMVVAAPGTSITSPADLDHLAAFHLRAKDTFVLHQGTWHWGPFPITADEVTLYNVQGLRYAEDNESCDLTTIPKTIEVLPHA